MQSRKSKPKTIGEYIDAAPKTARPRLRAMVKTIRAAAPGAEEGMKWSMPAFSYRRILVMFAVFKHHISLFPTPSAINAFAKDLKKFTTSKGTIQFPLDKPMPLPLIRRITAFRVRESKQDAKWRS